MNSLLDFLAATKERAKLLRREKRAAYKRKNKEFFVEYSRNAREKKRASVTK